MWREEGRVRGGGREEGRERCGGRKGRGGKGGRGRDVRKKEGRVRGMEGGRESEGHGGRE